VINLPRNNEEEAEPPLARRKHAQKEQG